MSYSQHGYLDRDTIAVYSNGLASFPVKDKGAIAISPSKLRENRRYMSKCAPLPSPTIVEITKAFVPDPTPESQLAAVMAANTIAQSRPSTPPPHGSSSSLAPPVELSKRPPTTPKRHKKTYDGLGYGTPPHSAVRGIAKEELCLKASSPRASPLDRPSNVRSSSGRSVSESTKYNGVSVDFRDGKLLALVDYPHYRKGMLTIATSPQSLLHFVPQVFRRPPSFDSSRKRSMIPFTLDPEGISIHHTGGVVRLSNEMVPSYLVIRLHYPKYPEQEVVLQFDEKDTHRKYLVFVAVQKLVQDLVTFARANRVKLCGGLGSWDPVALYDQRKFCVLGLKHLSDDVYIVALGVPTRHIPRDPCK